MLFRSFAVSDVITRGEIPAEVRRNAAMWVGCIAGALDEQHFLRLLREAGFANASIEPTRIYTSDDARIFAESAGLDPERLAADIDGKFLSGFVRAIKPRPAPAFDLRPAEPHDLSAVATLLHTVSLPSDDIDPSLKGFFVATRGRAVVGTIGLERYGDAALLRSVATSPKARNTGIGAALVHRAIDAAQAAGISDLYLLTTNASEWAARFGFTPIARDQVADAVRHSPQFTGGACSSAAAMHRSLAG